MRITTVHVVAALVLALRLAECAGQTAEARGDLVKATVDSQVAAYMAKLSIPGMALGVMVDGQTYLYNYGVASLQTREPVNPDTLFEIGSISKTLTVTLTAYATVTGKLALADVTGKYLPALAGTPFGKVQLLNLATHTTGGLPLQVPDDVTSDAQLVSYLARWKPEHPIGSYRNYSNISIGLLGVITATAMQQDFATLMEQRLFPAFGMTNSYINLPSNQMVNYAQGYSKAGQAIRMTPGELWSEAYGVRTTAADLTRFLRANLQSQNLDANWAKALTLTHTGYFAAGPFTQDLIWEQYPYPTSLSRLIDGNTSDPRPAKALHPPLLSQDAWINKTGSTNGFGGYVAFVPSRQFGIVILANKNVPIEDRVGLAYRIFKAIGTHQTATGTR